MIKDDFQPIAAHVAEHAGKPTPFINEQPVYPMLYSLTDCPGGRWTWEEVPQWNLRNFARQGITLYQVDLWFEHLFSEDGTLDIDLARRQLRGVLDVCPQAAIFIRLHINASPEWTREHPEECTEYADTAIDDSELPGLHRPLDHDELNTRRVSLASQRWREEATEKLRIFCQHLANTPEGDYLAGIQIACGVFGEWHYWGFISHDPDTGPAMTTYFRQWLQAKYQDQASFQAACDNSRVTFENARIPTLDERKELSDGIFRDPRTQQHVIDYYECQQDVVADDIIHFCQVTKENWPRPLITGTFYGYFFMTFGRQAAGGHLQMERLLTSPYVDYLSAPMSYQGYSRQVGGTGQSRSVLGACFRHGKLWLDEMDQASHLGGPGWDIAKSTLPDDIAIMRRNTTQTYTRGMGLWFYDFGPHLVSGWWDHPELLAEIRRQKTLFDEYVQRPFRREADVLIVYDTTCFYHLGYTWTLDCVSHTAVDELTADVYHSGVTFDDVLLFDLECVNWDKYRTVIFANTFLLSDHQRAYIQEHVARNGRHIIWNYMPGYTNGQRLDAHFVSELVGMKLNRISYEQRPTVNINHPDFPSTQFHVWNPVPLLVVNDPDAQSYGYMKDTGEVAFACKRREDSTSWFCTLPLHGPGVLREIFRRSGAHIYNLHDDVLYEGGGVLCLHTAEGGTRSLLLRNGKRVEVELAARSTMVIDSETGTVLL